MVSTFVGNLFFLFFLLTACNEIDVTTLNPDTVPPVDNGANIQFTFATDNDGNNLAMTWTPFTDDRKLANHRIILYTDNACTTGKIDKGLTGSALPVDNGIVDGITNGTYYATVTAYDTYGNSTVSACSTDSILVKLSIPPTDNGANIQFTDATDVDGNDIAMTWTAFTDDIAVTDHRIILYTDSSCTTGAFDMGLTGSASAIDNGIVDGLTKGRYYARVTAYDGDNLSTTSACSTDSILISGDHEKISAADRDTADLYGTAVGINGDFVIVGSPSDDNAKGVDAGSAYIYHYNTTTATWIESKITASDGATGNNFGKSADISNNTAIVGAPFANSTKGASYIYRYQSDTGLWGETKLVASDGAANDEFGASVDISDNTAVIGAPKNDNANGTDAGAAYIYQFQPVTNAWIQTKQIAVDGNTGFRYGFAVAVSGNMAAVSSPDNGAGAVYVYHYVPFDNAWYSTSKLTPSDGVAGDSFGYDIAISGPTIAVGSPGNDQLAADAGAVYVYHHSPITNAWVEKKITASDGAASEQFGFSVAVSANNLVAGSPQDDEKGALSGSAYFFQLRTSDHTWVEIKKLLTNDGAANYKLGYQVAISDSIAVAGAIGANSNAGAIYTFPALAGSMAPGSQSKKTSPILTPGDSYGISVSISGNTAIVGASNNDVNGLNAGRAFIYQFDPSTSTWTEILTEASDGFTNDQFGTSVAISGNTAVVGAPGDDGHGSAYIYHYISGSGTWSQTKVTASDKAAGDKFGSSVDVSDYNVIIGAKGKATDKGAAYLYQYRPGTGTSDWAETILTASDGGASDLFGATVSISGNTVVIGSEGDDDKGSDAGAVYIYQNNPDTGGWKETKLTAADGDAGDAFGSQVAISGNTIVAGSKQDNSAQGSAYVFQLNPSTNIWTQRQKLTATDGAATDNFGSSVAISGSSILVGASLKDSMGAAYLFKLSPSSHTWTEIRKITATTPVTGDEFGKSVSISGTSAIVGDYANASFGASYLIGIE